MDKSDSGKAAGFIAEDGCKAPMRHRSFATVELADGKAAAISASRMDVRHAHLDAMLDA